MRLPFAPPLAPMLSAAADALPGGEGWLFEPKWDGFRTLVFRDGDDILLQSRDEKPMNRYFPELLAPLAASLPERCVVDGEIVIVGPGRARLRGAAPAHPPGRVAREAPGGRDAGFLRRLGPPGAGRRGPARGAALVAPRAAGEGAGPRGASGAPVAGDARSRARGGLVPPLRGRRARRRHGQAPRLAVPRRRAHHDQGQARAHGRLRRRRLSLAQERRGDAGRLAPARPLRRRGHAPPRRHRRGVHHRDARAARRGARAAARERARRPSVARLGAGAGARRPRRGSACRGPRAAGIAARI